MMQPNKLYPFQLWFVSVGVVIPLVIYIWEFIAGNFKLDNLGFLFLFVVMGLGYSFPTLIVCVIIFNFLSKKNISPLRMKAIVAGLSMTGAALSLYLIGGSFAFSTCVCYWISIVMSSFFFNIYKPETI